MCGQGIEVEPVTDRPPDTPSTAKEIDGGRCNAPGRHPNRHSISWPPGGTSRFWTSNGASNFALHEEGHPKPEVTDTNPGSTFCAARVHLWASEKRPAPSRLTEVLIQRNSRQEKAGSRFTAAQSNSPSSVVMAGHSSYVLR